MDGRYAGKKYQTLVAWLSDMLSTGILAFIAAIVGRVSLYSERQPRSLKAFSIALLFAIPVAVFCAFIADGISTYFHFPDAVNVALSGVFGYLGPEGTKQILMRFVPAKDSDKK